MICHCWNTAQKSLLSLSPSTTVNTTRVVHINAVFLFPWWYMCRFCWLILIGVTNCLAIGHCVHFLFILLYTYMHVYVYTWIIKCHQLNNASSYIESRYSMWNNMTLWPSTVASCLEYFLWNCHQMFATRPHWLSINICAGNRLLPSDHCLN